MKRQVVWATLEMAYSEKAMVRVTRRGVRWKTYGWIVGFTQEWTLIQVYDDSQCKGWSAIRTSDIRAVSTDDSIVSRALALWGEQPKSFPELDLSFLPSLLGTVHRHFPLVTLHFEVTDPSVCYIGCVVRLGKRAVTLREIEPDASWDATLHKYQYSTITRVDFGGRYEEALWLFGGEKVPSDTITVR
jgi:hypothetical protein